MAFTIENGELTKYTEETGITEVVIPDRVTSIAGGAFNKCTTITSVKIPDSVKMLRPAAFYKCSSLANVEFPENLEYVGMMAFEETPWLENNADDYIYGGKVLIKCSENVKNLIVPEGIVSIAEGAFDECELESVQLPDSLKDLNMEMFGEMESLKKITIGKNITTIQSNFCNETAIEEFHFPDGLKEICSDAFNRCVKLKRIDLPNGLEEIGEWAFSHCEGLEEIILPDSLKIIEQYAFGNCINVKKLVLPNNDTKIYDSAFWNLPITELHIPEKFTDAASIVNAFFGNQLTKITVITVDENNSALTIKDGVLYSKDMTILYKALDFIEEIAIPDTVTEIEPFAFLSCHKLREVTMGDNITSIGKRAFADCESLTSVKLSSALEEIAPNLFGCCSSLKNIVLPQNLKIIGESAFAGCSSLERIEIPQTVNEIGYGAFANCTELAEVKMPEIIEKMQFGFVKHGIEQFVAEETKSMEKLINSVFSGTKWLDENCYDHVENEAFSEMLENLGELEVKTIRTISREGSRILAENPELISDGKKALILAANKALTVIDNSGKITGDLIQRLPVKIDLHSPDDIKEIALVCTALHHETVTNGTDATQAEIDTAEYVGSILMYEIHNLQYYKANSEDTEEDDTNDTDEEFEFEIAAETDGTHLTKLGVICRNENGETEYIDTLKLGHEFVKNDIEMDEQLYFTLVKTNIRDFWNRFSKALGLDELEEKEDE